MDSNQCKKAKRTEDAIKQIKNIISAETNIENAMTQIENIITAKNAKDMKDAEEEESKAEDVMSQIKNIISAETNIENAMTQIENIITAKNAKDMKDAEDAEDAKPTDAEDAKRTDAENAMKRMKNIIDAQPNAESAMTQIKNIISAQIKAKDAMAQIKNIISAQIRIKESIYNIFNILKPFIKQHDELAKLEEFDDDGMGEFENDIRANCKRYDKYKHEEITFGMYDLSHEHSDFGPCEHLVTAEIRLSIGEIPIHFSYETGWDYRGDCGFTHNCRVAVGTISSDYEMDDEKKRKILCNKIKKIYGDDMGKLSGDILDYIERVIDELRNKYH